MILRIARKECLGVWRDARFRWIGGVLLLLLSTGIAVGFQIYARRAAATAEAQQQQRDQWLHKTTSNAHVAAHSGTTLFRPLPPLAIIDAGIDDFVGTSIFLEPHRRGLFAHTAVERSPASGPFVELTAAFILQTLVPLLIVLLTHGAFAAEREDGTLAHLLSLGVRPRDLALGKALGLTAPVLVVIVPAMAAGLLTLHLRHELDASRAAPLALAYLAYVFLFVAIGLAVSARARTSQQALVALLGIWLIACFLIPRGAFALAQRLAPAPTPQAFVAALERADAAETAGFLEQRAAITRRLLAEYGVATTADLPVSTWGVTLFEREITSTERYNSEFARLFDAYAQQQRIVDLASAISPPLALRTLSMALAGADHVHYRHFADEAERYRYALVQTMNRIAIESRLYNSVKSLQDGPDGAAFPEGEDTAYRKVGAFRYTMPGGWWALARTRGPALALGAWMLLAGAALTWTIRHVRVA